MLGDMKIARVYLRVSTDEQDLTRQNEIIENARKLGSMLPVSIKKRRPVQELIARNCSE